MTALPNRSTETSVVPVTAGSATGRSANEREARRDLIERIAGIGNREIDLASDRICCSREQRRIHGVTGDGT